MAVLPPTSVAFGTSIMDSMLNFYFRGVALPSPPSNVYLSLGTSAVANQPYAATEISGMTRLAIPRHRSSWNGTNSLEYPYQSTSYGNAVIRLYHRGYLRIPAGYSGSLNMTGGTTYYMFFDAAAGGNLLMVVRIMASAAGSQMTAVAGDIIQPWYDPASVIMVGTTQSGSGYGAVAIPSSQNFHTACLIDWMLRGYANPFDEVFSPSTYPDVFFSLLYNQNPATVAYGPVAIPRNTTVWGAPSAGAAAGYRVITNAVDMTFGPVPALNPGTTSSLRAAFTMSNVAQSFDDMIAQIFFSFDNPSPTTVNGDYVRFPAGSLMVPFK